MGMPTPVGPRSRRAVTSGSLDPYTNSGGPHGTQFDNVEGE